ncbi:MAG: hypothetical protein QG670_811 [Thermoproteota archaeon]|nr:hypothetical protein [Thermoproteota archaeon]
MRIKDRVKKTILGQTKRMKLKIDLHVHTNHSDAITSVGEVVEAARLRHLDGIAITDHGTTSAFAQAQKLAPDLIVIQGMEVESREGHILVLGVKEAPPKDLEATEVAKYARQKGGVIIIAHPNMPFISVPKDIIGRIKPDAIETCNAKTPFFWHYKKKNIELAEGLSLPQTGGSDSHSPQTVGDMYTIVEADSRNTEAVLEAIRAGRTQPAGKTSSFKEKIRVDVRMALMRLHITRKDKTKDKEE